MKGQNKIIIAIFYCNLLWNALPHHNCCRVLIILQCWLNQVLWNIKLVILIIISRLSNFLSSNQLKPRKIKYLRILSPSHMWQCDSHSVSNAKCQKTWNLCVMCMVDCFNSMGLLLWSAWMRNILHLGLTETLLGYNLYILSNTEKRTTGKTKGMFFSFHFLGI